jgi:hypothetical protein
MLPGFPKRQSALVGLLNDCRPFDGKRRIRRVSTRILLAVFNLFSEKSDVHVVNARLGSQEAERRDPKECHRTNRQR